GLMKKILLLTDLSSDYSRNLLKGIVKYSKEVCSWNFYSLPFYFKELHGNKGIVKWAKKWGADAIIAQFDDLDLNQLAQLKIPIIVQNYSRRNEQVSNLTGDYYNTGVMAADFFYQKGFRQFAYYGLKKTVWMRERGEGFIERLKENNCDVILYPEDNSLQGKLQVNHNKLGKWVKNLPKPIAVFACDDSHALHITEICKIAGINIPNEIAVLGVDNDDLLCNISNPKLSSIELDVINGGYLTGQLLDSFLQKKVTVPVDIIIKPIRVVTRESTEKVVISNKYIADAITYIHENYMENISVKTINDRIPMSRRVMEIVFKKETETTIEQYIQSVRLEHFSNLLITTNIALADVTRIVGFNDYKN